MKDKRFSTTTSNSRFVCHSNLRRLICTLTKFFLPLINVTLFLWMVLSLAFAILSVSSSDICSTDAGPDAVLKSLIERYTYDEFNPVPVVGDLNYATSSIGLFSYYMDCTGPVWFQDNLNSATDYIDLAATEVTSVVNELTTLIDEIQVSHSVPQNNELNRHVLGEQTCHVIAFICKVSAANTVAIPKFVNTSSLSTRYTRHR